MAWQLTELKKGQMACGNSIEKYKERENKNKQHERAMIPESKNCLLKYLARSYILS